MHTPIYTPTLHHPVPLGTRVRIQPGTPNEKTFPGTVAGIASMQVIFIYIVILDTPIENEYGSNKAVAVPGTCLVSEDGTTHWRLEP